jgi:hypothetical protein
VRTPHLHFKTKLYDDGAETIAESYQHNYWQFSANVADGQDINRDSPDRMPGIRLDILIVQLQTLLPFSKSSQAFSSSDPYGSKPLSPCFASLDPGAKSCLNHLMKLVWPFRSFGELLVFSMTVLVFMIEASAKLSVQMIEITICR